MVPSTPASPLNVAVIGFGPGGMFFCHHLERKRRELLSEGTKTVEEINALLPTVTCFEQAGSPGGNWRADRTRSESLWTNGPKEAMEFFDYTFADHYGKDTKLPVFLPRAEVLQYMIHRVTKDCPDFIDKYVQFCTKVQNVTFDEQTQLFSVTTQNLKTMEESTQTFHKCIWAAGMYGTPNMPKSLLSALKDFKQGPVVHSTELVDWEKNAKDKHILLVGGSYSALDMAYTAIRNQARKVTIVIRDGSRHVPVTWPTSWPEGKVEIVWEKAPTSVNPNTQSIVCTAWDASTGSLEDEVEEVHDVDTIVLCTGFGPCTQMLDKSVWNPQPHHWVDFPKYWTMAPNSLDKFIPAQQPPRRVDGQELLHMDLYHDCISAANPHFMMIYSDFDQHLLAIDISTKLCLSCILGETPIPSSQEIHDFNHEIILMAMHIPVVRASLDPSYNTQFQEAYEDEKTSDDDDRAEGDFYLRRLAQCAHEALYPVDFGNIHGLSKLGRMLVEQDLICYNYGEDKKDQNKVTVHDLPPKTCQKFKSLYTGNVSVPLKDRWMKLDHTLSPVDMVRGNEKIRAKSSISKPKVLCLGVSYHDLNKTLESKEIDPERDWYEDDSSVLRPQDALGDSIHLVMECVQRSVITAMDGRDLARCIATEQACGVDVYTVSREECGIYINDRHIWANFNRPSFAKTLANKFPNVVFDQIVLDYFWIPAGWDESHWRPSFFETTLVNLAKMDLLRQSPRQYDHKSVQQGQNNETILLSGSVILPFCFHCFKEVVASFSALRKFYNISFLRKGQLTAVSLWAGTQMIDSESMQGIFEKQRNQEEVYCSFGPIDVRGSLDDARVSKDRLFDLARQLEDFKDIRFIALERLVDDGQEGTFKGLVCPAKVERGFDDYDASTSIPNTPSSQRGRARTVTPSTTSAREQPERTPRSSTTRRKLEMDESQRKNETNSEPSDNTPEGKRRSKRLHNAMTSR